MVWHVMASPATLLPSCTCLLPLPQTHLRAKTQPFPLPGDPSPDIRSASRHFREASGAQGAHSSNERMKDWLNK